MFPANTLGAAAKGRSSSRALSRILRSSLGYVLGSGLYPGGIHCRSAWNRADGPSRDHAVPGPSKLCPKWLSDLRDGVLAGRGQLAVGSDCCWSCLEMLSQTLVLRQGIRFTTLMGNWATWSGWHKRLLLGWIVVCRLLGNGCLTKSGGPWTMLWRTLSVQTWVFALMESFAFRLGDPAMFTSMPSRQCNICVHSLKFSWVVLGKLISSGRSKNLASAALFSPQQWCVASWPGLFYGTGIALAASLQSDALECCIQMSSSALREGTWFFPRILWVTRSFCMCTSKIQRLLGLLASSMCESMTSVLLLARLLFEHLPLDRRLFGASIAVFRRQWSHCLDYLGVPRRQNQAGATPGTLRGSGATDLYYRTEGLEKVAWRGRWAKLKTVE